MSENNQQVATVDPVAAAEAQAVVLRAQADAKATAIQAQTERDLALAQLSPEYAAMLAKDKKFELLQRQASLLAGSGMFEEKIREKGPDGKWEERIISGHQAVARATTRVMLGDSMGLGSAESMMAIDVINGRPAVASATRAARMETKCGIGWDIQWHEEKGECVGVSLHLKHAATGNPILDPVSKQRAVVSFLRADAEKIKTKIWEKGQSREASILEKDNWKATPKNMYFARAAANAQRFYGPSALNDMPIMSREEAMDTVTEVTFVDESAPKANGEFMEPRRSAPVADPKPKAEKNESEGTQEPAQQSEETGDNAPLDKGDRSKLMKALFDAGWQGHVSDFLKQYGVEESTLTRGILGKMLADLAKK